MGVNEKGAISEDETPGAFGPGYVYNPAVFEDRCDKCGTPMRLWDEKPCVRSLTQSPRHTITRFHISIPEVRDDA
jgi:hypothetical protein